MHNARYGNGGRTRKRATIEQETMAAMLTYTTLDGQALDLSTLSDREQAFLRRSYAAYCDDMNWADFANLVEQTENPLIAATGGLITRQVIDHPLQRAVTDLKYRLWFRQGKLRLTPGQDPNIPPFADEPLPVSSVQRG